MALLTFDLDGVLQRNPFRTGVFPHIRRTLAPFYVRRHPDTPAGQAEAAVNGLVRAEFRRRQEAGDWVGTYDWDDIIGGVARALGYDGAAIDVAALVRAHCTPEHIEALPGAHACLAALRQAGHTLKVLTNGFAVYQEPVLGALGLLDFFTEIITPERGRSAKPQPAFFACAGAPPALHVGDTLVHDIYGARQSGFAAVWVPPDLPAELHGPAPRERAQHPRLEVYLAQRLAAESHWHPAPQPAAPQCRPDYVALNLAEVPDIVAAWAAGR